MDLASAFYTKADSNVNTALAVSAGVLPVAVDVAVLQTAVAQLQQDVINLTTAKSALEIRMTQAENRITVLEGRWNNGAWFQDMASDYTFIVDHTLRLSVDGSTPSICRSLTLTCGLTSHTETINSGHIVTIQNNF